jgi:hypothetical protein
MPTSLPGSERGERSDLAVYRSSPIEWPGTVSVYPVPGPHPTVTSTGAHQIDIDFGGHRRLVQEIDGQAGQHDAELGSVCVTGPSPITWLPRGHTNRLIYQ